MSTETEVKKEDVTELNAQEQQLIAKQRERRIKLEKAEKAILAVLKKHNVTLQINPHSPFGSPQIIVVLK